MLRFALTTLLCLLPTLVCGQTRLLSGGAAPVVSALQAPEISLTTAAKRGLAVSDNITNEPTPQFNVDIPFINHITAGDIVKFYIAGSLYASHTFTAPEITAGNFTFSFTPLSDGVYSFTAKLTRSGIDSSASNTLSVTISTAARGAPVLTLVGGGTTTTNLSPSLTATFSNSPSPQVNDYVVLVDSTGTYYTEILLDAGHLSSVNIPLGQIGLGVGVPSVRTFSAYLLTPSNTLSASSSSFTFSIVPATLTINGTPVTTGTVNAAYTGFTVTGGGGYLPYTFTISSGSLPAGISLNSASGVVSGSPSAAGVYSGITIRITDSAVPTVHADLTPFTITVSGATQQWSVSDISAPQVLISTTTFTNDTLSMGSGAPFGANGGRAVNGLASGQKKYWEVTVVDNLNPSNQYSVALLTLSASLTGGYFDAGTGFAYVDNGAFLANGVFLIAAQSYTGGDKIGVAFDRVNNKVWMRKIAGGTSCQNWNNAPTDDPATNNGGFSTSFFSGDVYPAQRFFSGLTQSSVLNIGPTYVCAKPSGFGDW